MRTYKDLFEYDDIQIENKIRFSPSSFANYYENPYYWYKTQVMKENDFKGNTNTVIGTIIHARLASMWLGMDYDTDVEVDYISKYDDNVEVDCWKIADTVTDIWNAILENKDILPKADVIEQSVSFEIPNSEYFIGGTFDYLYGSTIGDIKTIATTPKQIKFNHKFQIYLYLLALRMNKQHLDLNTIEVIYIVKTKKPKVVVLSEPIDDEFLSYVKDEVKKMIKRLEICKENQEMIELMYPTNPNSYL